MLGHTTSIQHSDICDCLGFAAHIHNSYPDIFHYLYRKAYITKDDSPDKLYGRIDKDFGLFIVDEFHVYSVAQVVSLINTMLLIIGLTH